MNGIFGSKNGLEAPSFDALITGEYHVKLIGCSFHWNRKRLSAMRRDHRSSGVRAVVDAHFVKDAACFIRPFQVKLRKLQYSVLKWQAHLPPWVGRMMPRNSKLESARILQPLWYSFVSHESISNIILHYSKFLSVVLLWRYLSLWHVNPPMTFHIVRVEFVRSIWRGDLSLAGNKLCGPSQRCATGIPFVLFRFWKTSKVILFNLQKQRLDRSRWPMFSRSEK